MNGHESEIKLFIFDVVDKEAFQTLWASQVAQW